MYRRVLVAATLHGAAVQSQPTGCSEDAHCPSGFYCEPVQMFCRMCIQCKDFMREAATKINCVTSVTDCGACLKGYAEEKSTYTLNCISPELQPAVPSHGWVIIIVTLLVVGLLLCAATAYLLRNFKAYKLFAAIRTVERATEEDEVVETELLPPPPYNTVAATGQAEHKHDNDLATQAETVEPTSEVGRESTRYQTARVFNAPVYECNDSTLPSYEIAALREELETTGRILESESRIVSDHNQNIESATANRSRAVNQNSMSGDALEKSTSRVRQESSQSDGSYRSGESGEGSPTQCGSFFPQNLCIINVIRNNTSVQQHNDLKL